MHVMLKEIAFDNEFNCCRLRLHSFPSHFRWYLLHCLVSCLIEVVVFNFASAVNFQYNVLMLIIYVANETNQRYVIVVLSAHSFVRFCSICFSFSECAFDFFLVECVVNCIHSRNVSLHNLCAQYVHLVEP